MARRNRLDAELVRRGLARSREQAAALIAAGRVEVKGIAAAKAAAQVDPAAPLRVLEAETDDFVSRGGHKLAGALDAFAGLTVAGRRCLDAGASTGGFTDVLLRRGASAVAAVDVGYGQIAWSLRTDPRVLVVERTNVRTLTPEQIDGVCELTVADLSFISLRLVLPALAACTADGGDLVPMVKPQFEVGREALGDRGVVRSPELRAAAVLDVAAAAAQLGFGVAGVARSPLPGPQGNVEFFLWLRRDAPPVDPEAVHRAVAVDAAPAPPAEGVSPAPSAVHHGAAAVDAAVVDAVAVPPAEGVSPASSTVNRGVTVDAVTVGAVTVGAVAGDAVAGDAVAGDVVAGDAGAPPAEGVSLALLAAGAVPHPDVLATAQAEASKGSEHDRA